MNRRVVALLANGALSLKTQVLLNGGEGGIVRVVLLKEKRSLGQRFSFHRRVGEGQPGSVAIAHLVNDFSGAKRVAKFSEFGLLVELDFEFNGALLGLVVRT